MVNNLLFVDVSLEVCGVGADGDAGPGGLCVGQHDEVMVLVLVRVYLNPVVVWLRGVGGGGGGLMLLEIGRAHV